MLFDTHFHLDLMKKPEQTLTTIEDQKIYTIAVTNLPKVFLHTESLCKESKYVRPALGYHPELAAQHNDQLDLFKQLISRTKYIGEIGLDNQRKTANDYQIQKRVFSRIINICADQKNQILTVHSRKAEKDVIDIIGNNFPGKVIMHWYSGSNKEMDLALNYGFYFSINSTMTQSFNGKKIIERLPKDRILLETDGPFTSFENQPCSPLMTGRILDEIVKIKHQYNNEINSNFVYDNFRDLLKFDRANE